MNISRIWTEIVMVSTIVACVLAVLIAVLGAVAEAVGQTPLDPAARSQTYEGVVTCSRCGARHAAASGRSAAECTRMCVRDGAQLALVDGERMYPLDVEPDRVGNVIGQRARITGVVTSGRIRVISAVRANP